MNGLETVFGRDEKGLVGRLKFRTGMLGIHAHLIEQALAIGGRVSDANGR
jgi:hypothetical protein